MKIFLLIVLASAHPLVTGLWIHQSKFDDEYEDVSISLEDGVVGDSLFNSRGPRSLYRGLESDHLSLMSISDDYYQDFDSPGDDDDDTRFFDFFD